MDLLSSQQILIRQPPIKEDQRLEDSLPIREQFLALVESGPVVSNYEVKIGHWEQLLFIEGPQAAALELVVGIFDDGSDCLQVFPKIS